jgi:hypothetical protein
MQKIKVTKALKLIERALNNLIEASRLLEGDFELNQSINWLEKRRGEIEDTKDN